MTAHAGQRYDTSKKNSAHLLRQIRLQIGMTLPDFGGLIDMDSRNVAARESCRVAWRESEIESALQALKAHLIKSVELLETISEKLSNQGSASSPTPKL